MVSFEKHVTNKISQKSQKSAADAAMRPVDKFLRLLVKLATVDDIAVNEAHFALHDEPERERRRRRNAVIERIRVLVIMIRFHVVDDVAVLVLRRAAAARRQPAAWRRRRQSGTGCGVGEVDRRAVGRRLDTGRQRRRRHGLHRVSAAAANRRAPTTTSCCSRLPLTSPLTLLSTLSSQLSATSEHTHTHTGFNGRLGIAEFAGLEFAGLENDGVEQEQTYILHTKKNCNVYDM